MHLALLFDNDFLATADDAMIMDAIVEAAITDGGADFCDLQIVDPLTGALEIGAAEGFSRGFVENFTIVSRVIPRPARSR